MNFCRGYKVPPRSILNIRQIAEHVREVVGDPKNAMGQILEELLYSGTLDVVQTTILALLEVLKLCTFLKTNAFVFEIVIMRRAF